MSFDYRLCMICWRFSIGPTGGYTYQVSSLETGMNAALCEATLEKAILIWNVKRHQQLCVEMCIRSHVH